LNIKLAGLQLIGSYSSDSDEDEKIIINKPKSQILPLPKDIANWKGVQYVEENIDVPDNHDGRIRSFQHERGNWATLVYINYEPGEALSSWMTSINKILPNANLIINQCHISLSRTLVLKYHWIDSFVNSLKKLCQSTDKFSLDIGNLKIYTNEEKTRTFLGIQCHNYDNKLKGFMDSFSKILDDYKLPQFYQEASYHISFLWQLGNEVDNIEKYLPSLNDSLHDVLTKTIDQNHIDVDEIQCKIGNKLYKFPLRR
ncbi:U6 snRNA phosphodiesterase, partial [Aphidius gifuensis]|uniref:U6 snRNA phosphodiesterase n=1 Tax=Aphidius gifuensis TaxID=684658 RepID=UPI001CDC5D2C